VPPQALIAGLEALRPVVEAVDTGAALLLDLGRQDSSMGCADPDDLIHVLLVIIFRACI
jgi:hypothetical protein